MRIIHQLSSFRAKAKGKITGASRDHYPPLHYLRSGHVKWGTLIVAGSIEIEILEKGLANSVQVVSLGCNQVDYQFFLIGQGWRILNCFRANWIELVKVEYVDELVGELQRARRVEALVNVGRVECDSHDIWYDDHHTACK